MVGAQAVATLYKEDHNKISTNTIRDGVHARLDLLTQETLQVYEQIYENASDVVRKTLYGESVYFEGNQINIMLKKTNDIRKKCNISRDQAKDLLLHAGVIGIVETEKYLEQHELNIMEAIFQYQQKVPAVINENVRCVIHPMFFQELNLLYDRNTFIYPKPIIGDSDIPIVTF